MTLIEIIVVIALIGTMMALGSLVLFPGDESKVREEASRLAGTIRYVYNEAAIKNRFYRIAFDLDANQYRVESSTEPFYLQMEAQLGAPAQKPPEEEGKTMGSDFTEESETFKPVKLNSGVKFKDILTQHSPARQEAGTEYAYFLPHGWAEPMVVNLCSEDEEICYSLKVNPLTGKSLVRGEYWEISPEGLGPQE